MWFCIHAIFSFQIHSGKHYFPLVLVRQKPPFLSHFLRLSRFLQFVKLRSFCFFRFSGCATSARSWKKSFCCCHRDATPEGKITLWEGISALPTHRKTRKGLLNINKKKLWQETCEMDEREKKFVKLNPMWKPKRVQSTKLHQANWIGRRKLEVCTGCLRKSFL